MSALSAVCVGGGGDSIHYGQAESIIRNDGRFVVMQNVLDFNSWSKVELGISCKHRVDLLHPLSSIAHRNSHSEAVSLYSTAAGPWTIYNRLHACLHMFTHCFRPVYILYTVKFTMTHRRPDQVEVRPDWRQNVST